MLNFLDLSIFATYLLLVLAVGCGVVYRKQRSGVKLESNSFFLAGRSLTWPIIGLSLFSTNISTVHIVALAEEGYRNGLAFANFELAATFILVVLAVFFVPFYLRSRVATLPEFLEKRYNRKAKDLLAVVSLLSAVFIHIGTSLYAGGLIINSLLGFGSDLRDIIPTMILIAGVTGIYVAMGGLLAVTTTDAIQTTTLLIGSTIVTITGFIRIGGWDSLALETGPVLTSIIRPTGDASGLPWHSILIGYPIIGIWYWCTDQTIVQRVLGAKSEMHGQAGAIFAGFLKVLPMFIFVLPGLICYALVASGKLPPVDDPKNVYSHLVLNLLPAGLRGVVVAALMAALMGTIAGALNSISTLFAYDIYKRIRPSASESKLIIVGRITTVVAIILAILWSPVFSRFESLYVALASMISYVAPPITAVFLAGIFWRGATGKAAVLTLKVGFVAGLFIFLLDIFSDLTGWNMLFLHASGLLFTFSMLVLVIASVADRVPLAPERQQLVWKNPLEPLLNTSKSIKLFGLILILISSLIYFLFRMPTPADIQKWENSSRLNSGIEINSDTYADNQPPVAN